MTTTLYRPVGLLELARVWDSALTAFPPRLPHQPIFYPVANAEYAHQIARDWNTPDEASGYAGYITRFAVSAQYLAQFEPKTVGSSVHVEYWIPAAALFEFNGAIAGGIHIDAAYFGKQFSGFVPPDGSWRGLDATAQFLRVQDVTKFTVREILENSKAVFLNYLFWKQNDFSRHGVSPQQQSESIKELGILAEDFPQHLVLPGT